MRLQVFIFIALGTVIHGGIVDPAYARVTAPVTFAHAVPAVTMGKPVDSYDPHPQYSYAYDVQDALTGDSKMQHETRNGDVVQGSYSFAEADGTRRIVDYVADSVNGFNAVVRKEPTVIKAAITTAPVAITRPVPIVHASLADYGYGLAHAPLGLSYH